MLLQFLPALSYVFWAMQFLQHISDNDISKLGILHLLASSNP